MTMAVDESGNKDSFHDPAWFGDCFRMPEGQQIEDGALVVGHHRAFGQIAAEAAIDTPQQYFDEVVAEYVQRRNLVVKALNEMDGVLCPNPSGAFYAMAQLPVDDADQFCQWLLEDFSYGGATVMLAPASGFYSDPQLGKHQVRIAYVLNQASLQKAMHCLAVALQQYPGRTIPKAADQLSA